MKHIIIVDDRLENRYMLESLLKGKEFVIGTAKNGEEALTLARESPPDLIISDILMPVMDGFTLCKEWRKDESLNKIPFIFFTAAYTDPKDVKYALGLGADRFLIKPLETEEFLTVIMEVLNEFEMGKIKSNQELVRNETDDLREYNAILFRKLEDKLYKAEQSDRKLKQYAFELEQNIRKLEISEAKVKELNDTKNKLFSVIAIDLKSPFNSILGLSNILKEEVNEMEQVTIREYADMINRSALHAFRLLDNLLNWSMVQLGQVPYHPVISSLKEVTEEVNSFMTGIANEKKIKLIDHISNELSVNVDAEMIKTIIRNLVSNAIKFTQANGEVELNATVHDTYVEVSVRDNGIGMTKENLVKLFNSDSQFSTRGTDDEDGTGLGLLLCKEYVERHGGKIRAESEEGRGSAFYFTLPYSNESSVNKLTQREGTSEVRDDQVKNLKILIAEDDKLSTILLTKAVKSFSNVIIKVTNGVDAVETCRENPDIDLVLMDIKMPKMDGYEATKQIRQFNKDTIIIAQTAYSLLYDKQTALSSGCDDYISKPYNQAILVALIKKCFERQKRNI